MSIVVMKRKAAARSRPVSRGGFSLNGGHRNRGAIGRPTFTTKCSANDSSIVKGSTKTFRGYDAKRLLCCTPVVNKVAGSTTQSELLQTQVERNLSRQDESAPELVSVQWYAERKNGQNGAPYESYEAYIRKQRNTHCDCLPPDTGGALTI